MSFLALLSFQTMHQWLEHEHHHSHDVAATSEEAADKACDLCKIKCVAYEPTAFFQLEFLSVGAFAPSAVERTERALEMVALARTTRGP